jgi:lactoylglutathione lyase
MSNPAFEFEHVHIISADPKAAADWYRDMLGADVAFEREVRGAPQIGVSLGGMMVLIRGRRPGEDPAATRPMRIIEDYSSHDEWGTDHFGYIYHGDLKAFCAEIRAKGARFAVEPWEFSPGRLLCYISAPDNVSIELIQQEPADTY